MRVLVVSSKYPPEYSGSGNRAHATYKRLQSKFGINFEVLASGLTDEGKRRETFDGVKVFRIRQIPYLPVDLTQRRGMSRVFGKFVSKIRQQCSYWHGAIQTIFYLLLNSSRFDVMHIFGNVPVTSAAIFFAAITKKPIIVELVNYSNDMVFYQPLLFKKFVRPAFGEQAYVVCISEALKQFCLGLGHHPEKIWCRPNPVDEARFYPVDKAKSLLRAEIGLGIETEKLVLHLAKFIPRKNQLFMLDVLKLLPSNFKLLLAGPTSTTGPHGERDTAYLQLIKARIGELNLTERVILEIGFIKKPEDYYRASDVFVLPSEDEAFGTPFIEAMACAIPVVTNAISGVFDMFVKNGVNGYSLPLVPGQWADAIVRAAGLSQSVLLENSRAVLNAAGTTAIDQEYNELLLRITKR